MSLAEEIAKEFEEWYRALAHEHGQVPRAFLGVKKNGEQFVVVLNNIPWTRTEHVQRRVFLNWLCLHEELTAYAHAAMFGMVDDKSRVLCIAADDGSNLIQMTLPIVMYDDGKVGYDEAQVHRSRSVEAKWGPYIGLMSPTAVNETDRHSDDEELFVKIWEVAQKHGIWRQRRP